MRINIGKQTLENLYCEQELTQKEIATLLNVSRGTILASFRKFRIPTRNYHETLLLSYVKNPNRRQKLAEYLQQHPIPPHTSWNKGIPCLNQTKEAVSRAHKGHTSPWKGMKHSDDSRLAMSLAKKDKPSTFRGRHHSLESRRRLSEAHIGQEPWNKGVPMRAESKAKLREKNRTYWANLSKEEKERQVKAALIGLSKRPTRPEQRLLTLIGNEGLPFKYVGDGQFILGGKCPDFLNTNGKKQLIELFGVHWHGIFDVAERTEHFRQYGFDTLVIWEDELEKPGVVISKIKKFGRKVGA